jgi:hypothetical protein
MVEFANRTEFYTETLKFPSNLLESRRDGICVEKGYLTALSPVGAAFVEVL